MFLNTFYFCFPGFTTVYYLSPRTYHIVLFVSHDLQNCTTFLPRTYHSLPWLAKVYYLSARTFHRVQLVSQGTGRAGSSEAGEAPTKTWTKHSKNTRKGEKIYSSVIQNYLLLQASKKRQIGASISPTIQQNDELAGTFKNSVNRCSCE